MTGNSSRNRALIKTEILCLGLRPVADVDRGRRGGAGPSGGRYILVDKGFCVNAPMQGAFVNASPLELVESDGGWAILKKGSEYARAEFVPKPMFYERYTSEGIHMWKVALLHGTDCLASTVYQRCAYWLSGRACKFCGIELSLRYGSTVEVKTRSNLRDVLSAALEEGLVKHVTLTVGTPLTPDKGAFILAEAVRGIRDVAKIPVHVQLEPVERKNLKLLRDSGVDTIGIHVESFDPRVLESVCPGKPRIDRFLEAWRTAVDLFGEGQVSSYIIAGLGESDESIVDGAKRLSKIGVIPYLVPLRPTPGTPMGGCAPPSPSRMAELYDRVVMAMKDLGIDPTKNAAGCVRCGACSALNEFYRCL